MFKQFLSTSRPRFWIYLLGPYLIGLIIWGGFTSINTVATLLSFQTVRFFLYFSYPANLLVYGINDIFDYQTDKLNEKKSGYEDLIHPEQQKHLRATIIISNLPFLLLSILPNAPSYLWLFIFVISALQYSAPPLRAKAKPLLDTIISALVYIAPGYVGYYISWWNDFDWMAFAALLFWNMAMHAYSAIPDITADTQAGIQTVATRYGKNGTLWFCIICYLLALILSMPSLWIFSIVIWSVYIIMMLISFKNDIFWLYKYFPWINTGVWFLLFWYILALQFGVL